MSTALHDLRPDRSDIAAVGEATLWYLFVGAIGAAVGINIYASRLHPKVCDDGPVGFLMSECSRTLVGLANHYTTIATGVAGVCFLVGVGLLVRDTLGGDEDGA